MPVKSIFVTRFFQLVTKRQFAEAERILERLKLKTQKTEYNKGYLRALRGMLLVQRSSSDRYAFLPTIDLNNEDQLQNNRREFLKHSKSRLHGDYDRGFFSAWANYMRVLLKMDAQKEITVVPVREKPPEIPVEEDLND